MAATTRLRLSIFAAGLGIRCSAFISLNRVAYDTTRFDGGKGPADLKDPFMTILLFVSWPITPPAAPPPVRTSPSEIHIRLSKNNECEQPQS
jgi:hypothetical protein